MKPVIDKKADDYLKDKVNYLEKEIERMYDRLAKSGRDTSVVSDKLTRLKLRRQNAQKHIPNL